MSWVAAGVASAALTASVVKTISASSKKKKAEKELEKYADSYKPNQSILDYYNKALQRYSVNPTDSALYKNLTKTADSSAAWGIGALQDRRSGQAGISSILRGRNDAYLNAGVVAENEKSNRLNQLGGATTLKAAEDKYPFEMKYNLLSMKAGGANARLMAALNSFNNSANSSAQAGGMISQYYGGGGGGGTNTNQGNPPSDIRLKENYYIVGKSLSGINIYEFSYKGNPKRYVGVMAHEVPFAANKVDGYLHVDYSKIDVEFKEV
jgi:hypothetical protein